MSALDNKKLVQQVYTDSANRSGTTFADNLAEDAVWVVTGQYSWSHEFRGREAIQNGLMGHFRSFFAVRPRTVAFNFVAEGDYVVVEAHGDILAQADVEFPRRVLEDVNAISQVHAVKLVAAAELKPTIPPPRDYEPVEEDRAVGWKKAAVIFWCLRGLANLRDCEIGCGGRI